MSRRKKRKDVQTVTVQIKVLFDVVQAGKASVAVARCNEACNWIASIAFELQTADPETLRERCYRALRDQYGLPSQMAQLAIDKVCGAYARDLTILPTFAPQSAIAFDPRCYGFKDDGTVSIRLLERRVRARFLVGERDRERLSGTWGQADLVQRNGEWFLYVCVDVPCATPILPVGVLGVDRGIKNPAVTSDREFLPTVPKRLKLNVELIRKRTQSHRQRLQARGTKNAKRRLKKISRTERRFQTNVNHIIAKQIVANAQDTSRAIALEDLTGIKRDRETVSRAFRRMLGRWAAYQLALFIVYKARIAGVPVVYVDPAYTSTTCPKCDFCAKKNRNGEQFQCKSCGFEEHADFVGSLNVARRANVNPPIVSVVDARRATRSRGRGTRGDQGQRVGTEVPTSLAL